MEDNDLAATIARALDKLRDETGGPVWAPLEASLPPAWWGGFMFMGGDTMADGRRVWAYKHGITRRYLHVGEDLNAYRYNRGDYLPVSWDAWTAQHVADLEVYSATPETKYDAEYIAARNARLVAAGYRVIS